MDSTWKEIIWQQFGAAIDMLENAILACPEELWSDRSEHPEYWYVAYHTLFWLDLYLSDTAEGFVPPPPFTLSEFDPTGLLPERVYTKTELQTYLGHCRSKCRKTIQSLTDEKAHQRFMFGSVDLNFGELMLYNMRHVQHHAAQLNLILRQKLDAAPRWVKQTRTKLNDV
ncbi:MAG: DinB family protein [Candidatus Scalindua sp.]